MLKDLWTVLHGYNEEVADLPKTLLTPDFIDQFRNLKPCCELCWDFDGDKHCHGFSYSDGDDGVIVKSDYVCLKFHNETIRKIVDRLNGMIE